MEFIKNQKGKENLVFKNYIYNLHTKHKEHTIYRCQNRKCKARIKIYENKEPILIKEHTHEEDKEKILRIKANNTIKERSLSTKELSSDIITAVSKDLDGDVIGNMPKIKSLICKVYRERKKAIKNNVVEFNDIPESFVETCRNESFLKYDSGFSNEERIIILASDFSTNYLKKASTWVIDGTSKSVPREFMQLVTVHGFLFGKTIPLVYVLLKSKSQQTYTECFTKIRNITSHIPQNIVIDLEKPLYNALHTVFTTSVINSCAFHFSQSVWRNVQKFNLTSKYKTDTVFRYTVKKLLNLCFFEVKDVFETFYNIKCSIESDNFSDLKDFFCYFEKTYIRNKDQDPLFNISFWNVKDRVLKGLPRTTNGAEGWHRCLNNRAHISHPNILKFLDIIKSEEEKSRYKLVQYSLGKLDLNRRDSKKEDNLFIIVYNYENFDKEGYFKALESCYNWKLN